MATPADLVKQEGYIFTTICGRAVIAKYFKEHDETFVHTANPNTSKWNSGKPLRDYTDKLLVKYGPAVHAVDDDTATFFGNILVN